MTQDTIKEPPQEPRLTRQQQKALHLFFTLVAKELNDCGLDVRRTLKAEVDIPWSGHLVKELMWKPIQKIYTGKQSTTQLSKIKEIDEIYEIFNRHLGQRFGEFGLEHISFPSLEALEGQLEKKL